MWGPGMNPSSRPVTLGFEKISKSAVSLTKALLYQMDGMAFPEALETGVDVNVIARMSEDCQRGIARFLSKK